MDTPRPVLLMTRPRAASERFVSALPVEVADRVEVCIAPLMEIALSDAPITAADAQGVIFSSANGVQAARAAGLEPRLPAFCIGRATTAAATGAGWDARFAGEDADALVATLARTRPATPLLHLHGAHTRGDIAGRLTAGHARALLGTDDAGLQDRISSQIESQGLSVRAVERLIAESKGNKPRQRKTKPADPKARERQALGARLEARIGRPVRVRASGNGGTVTVRYESVDDLKALIKELTAR